ncbi:response regulator [Sediminibacillus massiliensis]|uniref:response regulator n=1 Tax=Sediminibacillus massiliensis TaxID=1926277 RepID=UPI0009884A8C|nr:response regulator [Sediminibacillus massiliensis]
MVKIMLVDDEPIEREGLRLILERNRSNFEIVAEAENGKQAVELAGRFKPDLIFMDIKMPEYDGLEAIEKILPLQPDAKCIMVSAYDTFDYARKAMKFGIKEYLLKPGKVTEVLEAYDRMTEEMEKEREREEERDEINNRLQLVSSFIETEWVVSLMMDHIHEFNLEEWNQSFNLDDKEGFAAVFSFWSEHLQPSRDEKSEWYRILKESLQAEVLHCLAGPLTAFEVPVFVLYDREQAGIISRSEFVRSVIHRVQNQLEDSQLLAGVGTLFRGVNGFPESYEEAVQALEVVHRNPGSSYETYSTELKQKNQDMIPYDVEKELVEAIKKGDIQTGINRFDTYCQSIQQAADYQPEVFKKAMEDFFIVLTRTTKELGFDDDVQMSFGRFETTMQIKEAAKSHLLFIIERIGEWRTNGIQGLLIRAKSYMESNYHKALTLEEVADQIGISSYYLSKLFKDRFQVTFVEYLTKIRLDQAKELLLDASMPLKEIALNVGYKDPNYFSRVFKKEIGISPRDYRTKHQK